MLHWTSLNLDAVMTKLRREHPVVTRSEVRRIFHRAEGCSIT